MHLARNPEIEFQLRTEWEKRLIEELNQVPGVKPALAERLDGIIRALTERIWAPGRRSRFPRHVTPVNLTIYPFSQALAELSLLREIALEHPAQLGLDDPSRLATVVEFFSTEARELSAQAKAHRRERRENESTRMSSSSQGDRYRLPEGVNPDQVALSGVVLPLSQPRSPKSGERAAVLAEATKFLLNSIDYHATLREIAKIALRTLADWCMIDVVQESGEFDRVIVLHRNPEFATLTEELRRDYRPSVESRGVPSRVLRTGTPLLIPEVTDEHYAATVRSARHEEILRKLESRSYMCIPMMAHGRFLGAVTLVSSLPDVRYDRADLGFAEELCARAALAVHNAMLFQKAERAVALRNDLVNIVSHDLKNPITAIQMSSELALRILRTEQGEQARSKVERSLESTLRSTGRMKNLISDLLDLSKIEASSIRLDLHEANLAELVGDVTELFRPMAIESSITLQAEIPAQLSLVCDPDRLSQALTNLVSNALKFTPRGGTVRLSAEEAGDEVWIHVNDTGPGIPERDLPHVFDRFWQAKATANRGTGLGLSIVKAMVSLHHGKVRVTSELGRGSRFSIGIPTEQKR